MTNKKKALLIGGGLLLGARMNTKEFKYYGLIGGDLEIKAKIYMVCKVISPATIENASKLLAETVAIETRNGKAVDYSDSYGEGLTQFDRPTFEDIKSYYSNPRFNDLMKDIKTYLFIDVLNFKYEDLRRSPMASLVFARLLYLRVPSAIPDTVAGRYEYYKKYFNSILGASTFNGYIQAQKMAVFV